MTDRELAQVAKGNGEPVRGSGNDLSFLARKDVIRRMIAVTLAFAMIGAGYALLAPKWYRSTVTLVPTSTPKGGGGLSALLGGDLGGLASGLGASLGSADVARISAVLQSAAVSDAVVHKFELQKRYDVQTDEAAREELWRHCEVKALPKPNLVQVSCEDRDPKFAQALLTYFVDYGNQAFRRVNVSSASEEVRYLERRVGELRQQADDSATRLRQFQEKHQIVELDAQARAVVAAMAGVNAQRIAKQTELGWARSFASRDESGARQLESQLMVLEDQLRDMEVADELPGPGAPRREPRPAGIFPAALTVPRLRAEYESLYRDRKVAEATLIFSLDRLENARAAEARDVSTFVILDPATLPSRKARPKALASVQVAALIGLALAVAVEWRRARKASSRGAELPSTPASSEA